MAVDGTVRYLYQPPAREIAISRGWGVFVSVVWDEREDGSECISDIAVYVCRIDPDEFVIVGGLPCVAIERDMNIPVENFGQFSELAYDDQQDFRCRWFPTETEARAHAAMVEQTWQNPPPWVSFAAL